jgi:tetratricopeptide (TPR) repeat protein
MNPKAIAAAKKALAIDETLAEAHASLASSEDLNWDWDASEREFRRALELNPNSARTHVLYAIHLEFLGKLQETLENVRRAIELDPLNLNGIDNLAEAYIYTGQYAESIEQSKKIVEIDPAFANVYSHLADAYRLTGQYELWLEAEEKVATLSDEPGRLSVVKAMKEEYAKSGFRGALKREAELVEEASKHTYIDPALLASIYGMLGDKDKAFAWLEKAYAEKSAFISYIKVARDYDSLRSDPRYTNLLKRMGLPQ